MPAYVLSLVLSAVSRLYSSGRIPCPAHPGRVALLCLLQTAGPYIVPGTSAPSGRCIHLQAMALSISRLWLLHHWPALCSLPIAAPGRPVLLGSSHLSPLPARMHCAALRISVLLPFAVAPRSAHPSSPPPVPPSMVLFPMQCSVVLQLCHRLLYDRSS